MDEVAAGFADYAAWFDLPENQPALKLSQLIVLLKALKIIKTEN